MNTIMNTTNKENTEILKDLLEKLKKNLDAVGREILKKKYATAYKKIMKEINEVSNKIIHEEILYLDLALVKPETLPEFAEILNNKYLEMRKALLDADFVTYMELIQDTSLQYANKWIECVTHCHVPGEPYIWNPLTLEKIWEQNIPFQETA